MKRKETTGKIPSESVEDFKRILGWMNRILDAIIEVLQSHFQNGDTISPGTEDLIELLKTYKKRAILRGFMGLDTGTDFYFVTFYRHLEGLDRRLAKAKRLAASPNDCKEELKRASDKKKHITTLHWDYFGLPFSTWYKYLYDLDKKIDRLDEALKYNRLNQDQLKGEINDLQAALASLMDNTLGNDQYDAPPADTDAHGCDSVFGRRRFRVARSHDCS